LHAFPIPNDSADKAQTAHAAIRINVEPRMSRGSNVFKLAENVAMIRFQRALWESLSPDMRCGEEGVGLRGSAVTDFQRTGIRIVASEVRGVHLDFVDFAWSTEFKDHPIVAGAASLAHPGDTVLLAPGCASMDMFANYNKRGDAFAEAVRELGA